MTGRDIYSMLFLHRFLICIVSAIKVSFEKGVRKDKNHRYISKTVNKRELQIVYNDVFRVFIVKSITGYYEVA